MKKFSLHIIFALLLCATAAIPASAGSFRFGVKAGVNINKMKYEALKNNFDSDNRAGFTAGLTTEFQVPIIGVGFDASLMFTRLYSQVGDADKSFNQSFFEIPINLKYKLSILAIASIIAPYVYTGPSFAFRVSGNDNWFKTRTFQPSWNVGIGLELVRHLQIGAGYSFGINNIFKSAIEDNLGGNVVNDIKARNNYWTVTAAYLF